MRSHRMKLMASPAEAKATRAQKGLCLRSRGADWVLNMRLDALAFIVGLALIIAPAAAEPSSAALQSYNAGDYLSAASTAEADGSPAALVFAARSLMAACMTTPHQRDVGAWLDRAERASEAALRLDPNSVDARLQL